MIKVQRIVVPDTRQRSWVLFNAEQQPLVAPNQYLSYLHCLGRSPNTVRAYAHHLQAFLKFLSEEGRDWKTLTLAQLAQLVAWLRRTHSRSGESREDSTINTVLAAVVPTKKSSESLSFILCFAKILCALKIARFPAATAVLQVIPSPSSAKNLSRTFSRRYVGSD